MFAETQAAPSRTEFDSFWQNLTPEMKAGLFLWPSLAGLEVNELEADLLARYNPSGIILFRRNFTHLAQARDLGLRLRSIAAKKPRLAPLRISIDEEGGRVSRLPEPFPRGKPAMELVDAANPTAIRSQVILQAATSLGVGIDTILAPVADVLTEPSNPVMGDRCWGRTAELATANALTVYRSLREMGIISCAKHFPGHGNTTTDSHKGFARSDVSLSELRTREWVPFQALIREGIPCVMTAHVLVPALDPDRPATLSKTILETHLRRELGFQGIIMSDDLRMNAIAEHYKVKRGQDSAIAEDIKPAVSQGPHDDAHLITASQDALTAGCDVLLSCQSVVKEELILNALARRIESDAEFSDFLREKGWRICRVLANPASVAL